MADQLFVYCPNPSNGARDLVHALNATRLRNFDGLNFWSKRTKFTLPDNAAIINWGGRLPELDGIRVLNGGGNSEDKYQELITLVNNVRTPNVYLVPRAGAIPRRRNHSGGTDIIKPPKMPAFYTQKLDFVSEVRIHSFSGKSIKAGQKKVRPGWKLAASEDEWLAAQKADIPLIAHPWWRSYNTGWFIDYTGFKSTPDMRQQALESVAALKLTFGAVDIGVTSSDVLYTLEVNRAPGIEGNTISAYTRAIGRWLKQEAQEDDGEEAAPPAAMPAEPPIVVPLMPPNLTRRWAELEARVIIQQQRDHAAPGNINVERFFGRPGDFNGQIHERMLAIPQVDESLPPIIFDDPDEDIDDDNYDAWTEDNDDLVDED
jgi:hypothetical protein